MSNNTRIELVKAEALRRLRPFLKLAPSWFRRKARAKRAEAIREYLAEILQAQLMALIDGQALPPAEELAGWFDRVLSDAVENAGRHPDVVAAADEHRDALFDIVRSGFLAEVDLRQRRWEAAGMGGSRLSPESFADSEANLQALKEEAIAEGRLLPDGTYPKSRKPEPSKPTEPPALTWEDISVIFLSEERVQVTRGKELQTFNYAEFGFADGRSGKPDLAWETLRTMAENKGFLDKQRPRVSEAALKGSKNREQTKRDAWEASVQEANRLNKRVQTIRTRLTERFEITEGTAITFTDAGYQANFNLGVAPSYRF